MNASKWNSMNRSRGFTLIELAIVLLIIAILAAIAIPSYSRYAFRARRTEGQQLLQSIAMAEERYYATHNQYGSIGQIGFGVPTDTTTTSQNGYYIADLPASAGSSSQAFTAEAVPQGAQLNDACQKLTINNAGAKTPVDPISNPNGNCW